MSASRAYQTFNRNVDAAYEGVMGGDPVAMGSAGSMGRPRRNATGATFLSVELAPKRLELLRELALETSSVALLVNPKNPTAAIQTKDMQKATTALGLRFDIVSAYSKSDFDGVFATLVRQHSDALVVSSDPVFLSNRDQLVALAARHSMPSIYFSREFAAAGASSAIRPVLPIHFARRRPTLGEF